eukprot:6041052-Ditylum_brightwellii.AAC.1
MAEVESRGCRCVHQQVLISKNKKSISVRNPLSGEIQAEIMGAIKQENMNAEQVRKKQNDRATSSLDWQSEGKKKKYNKFKAREKKHKLLMLEKDN